MMVNIFLPKPFHFLTISLWSSPKKTSSRSSAVVAGSAFGSHTISSTSLPPSPDESMPPRLISYCTAGPHFHTMRMRSAMMSSNIARSPFFVASCSAFIFSPHLVPLPCKVLCILLAACVSRVSLSVSALYMRMLPVTTTACRGKKPVHAHAHSGRFGSQPSSSSICRTAFSSPQHAANDSGEPPYNSIGCSQKKDPVAWDRRKSSRFGLLSVPC
mmetsp:Transcript_66734/g.183061  ORF Transcript_66734/g.183061 Transcript_66734/m.183061 type:complete len:215 (-) Transcript_66734:793-1437(-)